MAEPSKEILDGLALSKVYTPAYLDRYDIREDTINPLAKVVPCLKQFAGGDNSESPGDQHPFFGPFVCNIVCLTGPYVRTEDDGGGWEEEEVDKCKAIIKGTYDKFSAYECHFFIDADATAAADPDNADAMDETEGLIEDLCSELAEYGFTYHGRKDAGEIDTEIRDVIKAFQETIKPDNS